MRLKTRIERLERKLMTNEPELVSVVIPYGESKEMVQARYCEEHGISPEKAEKVDWVFVSRFGDPAVPYQPPAAVSDPPVKSADSTGLEIATIIEQLKAEGLSEQEILDEVYAEPNPQEDPPEENLSGECLEEKRRLAELWQRRQPRGQGFLRPVDPLRHDDLTKLFTKRRGRVN